MQENNQRIRNRRKELTIEAVVRFWGAGAVYFFIGWGTGLGSYSDPFDFIFMLGVAIGLLTIAVIDPLVFNVLDIERKDGSIRNLKARNRSIMQNVIIRSGEFLRSLIIVVFIFFLYNILNIAIINILSLPETEVVISGEPILFGLFYIMFYYIIRAILSLFYKGDK